MTQPQRRQPPQPQDQDPLEAGLPQFEDAVPPPLDQPEPSQPSQPQKPSRPRKMFHNRKAGPDGGAGSPPPAPGASTGGPVTKGAVADQLAKIGQLLRDKAADLLSNARDVDQQRLDKMQRSAAASFVYLGSKAHTMRLRKLDKLYGPTPVWYPTENEVEEVSIPAGYLLARYAPDGTELIGSLSSDLAAAGTLASGLAGYFRHHQSEEDRLRRLIDEQLAKMAGAQQPYAQPPAPPQPAPQPAPQQFGPQLQGGAGGF